MRNKVWILVALLALSLAAGCNGSGVPVTARPTLVPQPTNTLEPAATLDPATGGSTPVCPPADGEGTISPAISIYSIVFIVNGVEQVVHDGDALQALPGENVQIKEVTICVGPFTGNGGGACVDFAPVTQSGQAIASEHRGTHTVKVTLGFISIPGPDDGWTIGENWKHISAVLNHWPPEDTEDLGCGSGHCERDDRIIVGFRT